MPFPKQLLADHEKVVFDLKPHWVALLPPALWSVIALVTAYMGVKLIDNETAQMVALGVIAILWYVLALLPALRWRFTNFVLTTDRLITRQGIIAKHSREIPLERINDVAFNQSIIERMLGAGDLMIESAGERGQTKITNVRKPEQVQLMIYKETESNNNRMMRPGDPAPRAKAETTVTDQIEALARLKEQGAISEIEYENKKQELLKRL